MQNIDLTILSSKKKFSIDEDENRVIELDTSDLGIIDRSKEFDTAIADCFNELDKVNVETETEENLAAILHSVDARIRQAVDTLFDSKVCEVCYPKGYMFSIKNGSFIFMIIVETLSNLYEKDLQIELKKMESKINKRTEKYRKGK